MEQTEDEGMKAVYRQAISGEILKEPQPHLQSQGSASVSINSPLRRQVKWFTYTRKKKSSHQTRR